MTQLVEIGADPVSGRRLYFVSLSSVDQWPADLRLPSEHFVLFLATDARATADEALLTLALTALAQGLVYLCAWGPDCARLERLFDRAIATTRRDETEDSVILTTSHPEESLDQALRYFLHVAFPAADYDEACRSLVLAAVGPEDWVESIRNRLADPEGLWREIEQGKRVKQ
jgi:hypothetical protein